MNIDTRTIWVRLAFVLLALSLSACVSFPKQPFDKHAAGDIKRIAVIEVEEPAEYSVVNFNPAMGAAFGLIGGLIEAANNMSKTTQFSASAKELDLHLGAELAAQIKQALEQRGYQVSYVTGVRTKKNAMIADYAKVQTDADAILDVVLENGGYYSGPASSDYTPWLRVSTKLVSTRKPATLYVQTFNYGEEIKIRNVENIKPDAQYAYPTFDKLRENKAKAIEGLRMGLPQIVERVTAALATDDAAAGTVAAAPPAK